MRFVLLYFVYVVIYFIMNILTLNFTTMLVASPTPEARSLVSIGCQDYIQNKKRCHMNGVGKGC